MNVKKLIEFYFKTLTSVILDSQLEKLDLPVKH